MTFCSSRICVLRPKNHERKEAENRRSVKRALRHGRSSRAFSRIPFYFNDVRAGHIERTDAEFLASTFRFCDVRPDAFVFTAEDSGQASRRLAAISHLYKGTDKVFAWRDELLSVTASDDIACESPLTVIERAMCRPSPLTPLPFT